MSNYYSKDAMTCNSQRCYVEFRMYPPMLRMFTLILRYQFGLRTSQHIDVYEQIGMFLCILAHGKCYRQVSLETIRHYFKLLLWAVLEFPKLIIRPNLNYNNGAEHHVPDRNKHLLFQDCICAIDGTHVRAILPWDQRMNFIRWKGFLTQNVLAACNFNLWFTFVLVGTVNNT